MLGIMRKYQQSIIIKLVFGIIVLSFVGTIFLVWGRGGDKMSGSSSYAARVNGTKISIDEFQRSYYRLRNIYEQIYGKSLSPEIEKQMGIRKMALDSLVNNTLIRAEAKRMGIKVSKDEVRAAIATMPEFQKNGAFDLQQYQQVLQMNRLTPKDFEESKKEELLIKKTRQEIESKTQVSDDEALQAFKKQHDKVDLQFVGFSPADVKGEVKLSEQDLNSYLQGHPDQFKAPEEVSIAYCLVDPAKAAAKTTVTDEEAQTFYQKNIDRYQGKGGILPFAEVKERAKGDALKAKVARDAYEAAADALNKNLKAGDLAAAASALGAKVLDTPLFTMAAPPAALAGEAEVIKRAFALKQGELGGPVETPRGIYLLKLKEKQPAAVPPLAKIKAQVERAAAEDKARELARKKAEDALAALAKGGAGQKLQETGSFAYAPKGDIPRVGTSPEVMEAAFSLTAAAPVAKTSFKVGDRWYAIKLKDRTAADTADFQKTKEQIKQSMLPKKQQEALNTWLDELRKKAKIETNDALLAD
jgi:peptidyl-prolyl cis-trans isomerase D